MGSHCAEQSGSDADRGESSCWARFDMDYDRALKDRARLHRALVADLATAPA